MSSDEDEILSISDDLGNDEADVDDDNGYSRDSSPLNALAHLSSGGVSDDHGFGMKHSISPPNLPKELELRPSKMHGALVQPLISVWAKNDLKACTQFGPYPTKIRKDPIASNFNWKVTDKGGTFTAWLEILDFNAIQWITCLRKADYAHDQNAILLFHRGQLYIELTTDVANGKELLLISTEVLLIPEDNTSKSKEKAEGSLLSGLFNATSSQTGSLFGSLTSSTDAARFFSGISSGLSTGVSNKFTPELISPSSNTKPSHLHPSYSQDQPINNRNSSFEDIHPSSSSDATIRCSLCEQTFPDQLR